MRTAKRCIVVVLFVLGLGVTAAYAQQPATSTITAEELKAKMASNQPVLIVDVRSPEVFANSTTTVKGSYHFKVRHLKYRSQFPPFKDLPRNGEVVTYCTCPKDEAAIQAAQILRESGFTNVRVLQGGWNEWMRAKGPVEPRARN
ncbi:MAG TPA: rhodanese-like domain-containing protein [Pyrinomonadaceae bacterium]|jgi:rhodanese-related sulfurtransferase|nr:rhodanese-like domain-containing protein [Pyrinomonadaceae bacterium]